MTQDEVDLIYDYLHKNYEYKDGDLIAIIQTKGKRIGERLGHFNSTSQYPSMKASINILNKNYTKPLASFVYLYFNKLFYPDLDFIDGNIVNTKIENLKIKERSCSASLKRINKGFIEEIRNNKIIYRCLVSIKGKKISLGYYESKDECMKINKIAKEILGSKIINELDLKKEVKKLYPKAKIRITQKRLAGMYKKYNKYVACIYYEGKKHRLGSYNSENEAHEAYLKAKKELEK